MKAPIPGIPSTIYLASTSTAIRALLTQDDDSREERPMSYVSRLLQGAGTRYPEIERLCLALVYTTQRLRHFFLAHKLHLMAISPKEVVIPTARVITINDMEWDATSCASWRWMKFEGIEERRREAEKKIMFYQKRITQAFNRTVKPRQFKEGDLVLRVVEHVRRQVSGSSKFAPQWEGPFIVKKPIKVDTTYLSRTLAY
ncbi:hypothetical protein M0R45_036012 [Rubus argutus]|uniref:Reverse transcriptase/retrotransposon-derived protein RNase H-like domain-containing protein n=1 Tax=Rubus argutus TaxID=59490 RepID=A0AAW1VXM7_RUBAR